MFDAPVDVLPVWIGVAAASLAALAVVTSFPVGPPPDAAAAASTVDAVAASEGAARTTRPLRARSVRLARDGLALRGPLGETAAPFAYGPVTPVAEGTRLSRVLSGAQPGDVFRSPARFAGAVRTARQRAPVETDADRITARRVRWEGIDVTLVGA